MTGASSHTDHSQSRFQQIVDALRHPIVDGTLPEKAALPSERTVAEQHGVSRMTARRALEALETEGLAYSEGRRGRFVSPRRVRYNISEMVSFVADAQTAGRELEIVLIEAVTIPADAVLSRILAVAEGDALYAYQRLFRTGGHALFVETEYVSANRFPGLLQCDLGQSTTQLIERDFGTVAATGDISIRMRAMSDDEAHLMGLAPNRAGLELEQVIRDSAGAPFCLGRQIWRGELAEFTARAMVNARALDDQPHRSGKNRDPVPED
ncbi:MAG: GntR family transcriptional regulator [Aestuariivita sp.]|jgi:GntR family transcriptional regulator|nr:GntR family transcriptional regulator [Aestuariivita sp.]